MVTGIKDKLIARKRRHLRVRKKVLGTHERPRLSVFRSSKHIYVQLIDDMMSKTIAAASSLDSECRGKKKRGSDRETAGIVGSILAKRAQAIKIKRVVFDRNGYLYHGRVKALADGARKEGLIF
jgi:large subunit ribosomal protein L18